MSYLNRICDYKREELAALKRHHPLADVRSRAGDIESPRDFRAAVADATPESVRVIAEIKKASPSRGVIVEDFDPIRIATTYQEYGAAALSVLTDANFFQGSIRFIHSIKKGVGLPVLRKDFTLDEYHIYEARAAEADAILLIARLLDPSQLQEYQAMAAELGMTSLVEIHDEEELHKALGDKKSLPTTSLLGINNRDLETFTTNLATTEQLVPKISKETKIVSESGIGERDDIERLTQVGVCTFLVGEALLTAENIGKRLERLLGH